MDFDVYLNNQNVKAFLRAIRLGETSQDDRAYRTLFGGGTFASFADHPRIKVTVGRLTSTAAGAYQFLSRTWDGLVKQYGFTDFSPLNQDKGAIALIKGRKALEDVVEGRIEAAVAKCNREWASLPGSPYGQPVVSLMAFKRVYEEWGGTYSPAQTTQKEKKVEPISFTLLALNALSKAIPLIRELFPSSEVASRNMILAEKVVDISKEAIGAKNEQELIDLVKNNPEVLESIEKAVKASYFELQEVGGGIVKAREHSLEMTKQAVPVWKQPAFVVTSMLMPLVYLTVTAVLFKDGFSAEVKSMVIATVVSGILGAISGFWLGTSFSSQKKDDALLKR